MAAGRTLTAADALITLNCPDVFNAPFTLHEFSVDDVFDTPEIDNAETAMGVDGYFNAGFIFVPIDQSVMLQATSLSVDAFEQIYAQEQQNHAKYAFSGTTTLLAVQKQYVMTQGFLVRYSPMPKAGKTLKPRTFGLRWGSVAPGPTP